MTKEDLKELKELKDQQIGILKRIQELESKRQMEESLYGKYIGKYIRYNYPENYQDGVCMYVEKISPKCGHGGSTSFKGVCIWPEFKEINRHEFYLQDADDELDDEFNVKFTIEEISKEEFFKEIDKMVELFKSSCL